VTDLFGNTDPGASIPGDLFEGMNQGMREALAQLREKAHAAETAARLRPDDRDLQRRAARTRREYLQLREPCAGDIRGGACRGARQRGRRRGAGRQRGAVRMSAAWKYLRRLAPGDAVPAELYVLDYRDGDRPRWTVHSVEELDTGGRVLVLVDMGNGADELFGAADPIALRVITHPTKTLRTQPFPRSGNPPPMLCDLDQQGRHVAKGVR
jgi:hypothetical protein